MRQHEATWRQVVEGGPAPGWAPVARAALSCAAAAYGAGVRAYRATYDAGLVRVELLPVPVIGVGNLTMGGTGKSTTVASLVRWLEARGERPAILSRGYGSRSTRPVTVVADRQGIRAGVAESGDEPQMLARALPGVPVLVGRNRRLTGRAAVSEHGATVCVLDDSFQYWRLRKDLEIVLVDAAAGPAARHLFPRGLLREPFGALRRAHAVILTHADRASSDRLGSLRDALLRRNPRLVIAEARHRPARARSLANAQVRDFETLREGRWLAVSSLGDPASFPITLAALGIQAEHVPFPDHHPYSASDLEPHVRRARSEGLQGILTTEKDAVKLAPEWFDSLPVWVISIELQFCSDAADIEALLEQCLADPARTPEHP